ncbi:DUF6415 family natural product biosynthesis protein [Streptomyces sp. NBC_01167]|uniref:DUF6415 family natural product biosynthesis protein n=1 Tax=Streptomyces sp. NBC_01167 TaxID=2903756 RepID=UPI0038643679|nr:DUF6415 family natural product biosynthesis protein [Streptomyces sp. NBC_01167]
MTHTTAIDRWNRPIPAWRPPLESEGLRDMLEKFRRWDPYDGGALLDDVGVVMDEVPPPEDALEELAERLRGHLMQLVDIAIGAEADDKDEEAAALIERARAVRSEDMPGDHRAASAHLRRLAWAVNELLERMVSTGCVKAPDLQQPPVPGRGRAA